jgi:hypothetical protein
MLYRLAMCSYFRHRPPRFVDSCRSPVESAHRPRSKISYLDCLSWAQQSPSHAIPHSRRGLLILSQTHGARVKYHDGEPDELDRIMHESRKEFPSGVNPGAFQGGAFDKKGRTDCHCRCQIYRWCTNSPISSSPEPVSESPCGGPICLPRCKPKPWHVKLSFFLIPRRIL